MKQWIDHMKAFHSDQWNRKIHMSTWYCDISHDTAIQFNDRENFLKHMKDPDSHPGREPPTELQLDTLSRKKHRVLVRENEYCCPMCDCVPDSLKPIISTSDPAAIKDRLYKHIAQHIKDLAFKSIPVLDNAEPRNGSSGTDGEERDHLRAENSDASYPSGFDDSLRETPLTFDENPVRVTTTIREEFFYDMEETNDTYLDDIGFNDYRRLETAQVWGGPDAILDHFAKAQQNPSPTVQPKSKDDFAIAICCVLPVEVEAVESLFDDIYGNTYGKQPADGNSYVNGRIGNHNVVLCLFPGPGKLLAARAVVSLRVSYPGIRLVLRVGICGGAPHPSENQQIFLGDILISDSLIAHDFGSQYPNSFVRKGLVGYTLGGSHPEIQALLNGLNAARSRRRSFERDTLQHLFQLQQKATHWQHPYLEDVLFGHDEKQVIRRRGRLGATPTVHIGTIASGDMVIKSAQHRDKLVEEEKVIGFVMEGIGMWESSPLIFVNGVCDYADSHKSKEWQYYAAASAASAAKALLSYFNPTLREG
jgi:nucleoside phosphorylase